MPRCSSSFIRPICCATAGRPRMPGSPPSWRRTTSTPGCRAQGQSAFVWAWMGALGRDDQAALRHRRDAARLSLPPGDHRPGGGDARSDVPGPLLPGAGRGRGAERAHRRRILAGAGDPAGGAGRGDRDDPASSSPARSSSTRAPTSPWRAPGSTPCRRPRRRSTSPPAARSTAERTGRTCDGIITVGAADEKIKMLLGRFEKGAREAGKDPATMPRILQLHVSWAETRRGGDRATRSRSGRTAG